MIFTVSNDYYVTKRIFFKTFNFSDKITYILIFMRLSNLKSNTKDISDRKLYNKKFKKGI